jgi:hypothetical protein
VLNKQRKNTEWYLALFALATIFMAWGIGKQSKKEDWHQIISNYYPDNIYQTKQVDQGIWKLKGNNSHFFLVKGEGEGYSGYIKLLLQYDKNHNLQNIHVVSSSETPSYFQRVKRAGFFSRFQDKDLFSSVKTYRQIEAVSGATKTCEGVVASVHLASSELAGYLDLKTPGELSDEQIKFGAKEALVLLLFALGIISRIRRLPYKNVLKWITLGTGLVFLGFVYNSPITLSRLNSFLLGFWPNWHSELHIYLLFFGVLIILLTSGRNIYCHSFCPFGALQEVLGRLSKASKVKLNNYYLWVWFQRALAWIVIILALVFRNPSISEYEVFGAAFQFTGSHLLFVLLAITVIASLVFYKPWCYFLCPVNPVFSYLSLFRQKIRTLWARK